MALSASQQQQHHTIIILLLLQSQPQSTTAAPPVVAAAPANPPPFLRCLLEPTLSCLSVAGRTVVAQPGNQRISGGPSRGRGDTSCTK